MSDNPELTNPSENPAGDREHLKGRPYSHSTYTNHGCRCDRCRAIATEAARGYAAKNRDHLREYRRDARERRRGGPIPEGLAHAYYTYNEYGCRCDLCRAANAAKNRATSRNRRERES